MPKPRSPDRAKSYEIYKEHNGDIENRRIAEMLGISEKTVGGWKCKDAWEKKLNGVLQTKKRSTPKRKGGQPGNKNAVGHGGTGPPGNKNAVKTGEFETLFFDSLDAEEIALIGMIQPDKEKLLLQEIQLMTVRERRMLKRIYDLKQTAENYTEEKTKGMTAVKYRAGIEKDKCTKLTEYTGVLGQIQAVEDALTRVQARKQKAIDSLHRYGFDDARLEIEMIKLDMAMLKLDSQEGKTEDDGFLEALNAEASNLWEV